MADVWILAEVQQSADSTAVGLRRVTHELVTAARGVAGGNRVCAVLAGHGVAHLAGAIGADTVFVMDDPALAAYSPDGWAKAIAAVAAERKPGIILGASTARGRDLTPRIAAILGAGLASDCIELGTDGTALTALRPMYAGKALARVRVTSQPAMATLRPNSYAPAGDAGASTGGPTIEAVPVGDASGRAVVTRVELTASTRPDVSEADIIVSGGRGMGGPEHFAMLEQLADALGAAVGASRAVVDAGWRPHSDQVGQTGKTVSPSLYIACGISGAVQHLAGMKTSKLIIAFNKDAEAPIFSVADYGIVGDVFEIVPAFTEAVRALHAVR
ncbi:MAG: electron transfer flavoprotein subunit alpha/FixB family protein [Ardenticatenales bacterium]|nr:electron transfer flavoprotein subunit alpha/FixB family protein [Ardenticatenales bacterium]